MVNRYTDELVEILDDYQDDCPDMEDCPDPDCNGTVVTIRDNNYGSDRDGRRGIEVHSKECVECGESPDSFE